MAPSNARAAPGGTAWQAGDVSNPSDSELMRRAQHGDRQAFATLCVRYTPVIDAALARLLGHGQAPDCRQEALLRAWKRRGQYRARRGTVRSWLLAIALNVGRDTLRARRRSGRTVSIGYGDIGRMAIADTQPDPAIAAETADWLEHVQQVLVRVLADAKPPALQAWELRQEGITYEEIAQRLGKPMGSVATMIFKVRKEVLWSLCDTDQRPDHQGGVRIMSDDASTRLNELEQRQDRLEQALRQATGVPPRDKLVAVLDRLRQLKAAGQSDPSNFRRPGAWFDLDDAIDEVGKVKDRLLGGFFRRTRKAIDEARPLLIRDPYDPYALNQLDYVERSVIRIIQVTQGV